MCSYFEINDPSGGITRLNTYEKKNDIYVAHLVYNFIQSNGKESNL